MALEKVEKPQTKLRKRCTEGRRRGTAGRQLGHLGHLGQKRHSQGDKGWVVPCQSTRSAAPRGQKRPPREQWRGEGKRQMKQTEELAKEERRRRRRGGRKRRGARMGRGSASLRWRLNVPRCLRTSIAVDASCLVLTGEAELDKKRQKLLRLPISTVSFFGAWPRSGTVGGLTGQVQTGRQASSFLNRQFACARGSFQDQHKKAYASVGLTSAGPKRAKARLLIARAKHRKQMPPWRTLDALTPRVFLARHGAILRDP